jgi:uncharacterized membrane protein
MSRVVLVGESWFTYSVHPLFVIGEYEQGRAAAFASNIAPTLGPARIHAMVRLRHAVRPPRALGGEGGPRLSTDLARPVSDR